MHGSNLTKCVLTMQRHYASICFLTSIHTRTGPSSDMLDQEFDAPQEGKLACMDQKFELAYFSLFSPHKGTTLPTVF